MLLIRQLSLNIACKVVVFEVLYQFSAEWMLLSTIYTATDRILQMKFDSYEVLTNRYSDDFCEHHQSKIALAILTINDENKRYTWSLQVLVKPPHTI